MVNSQEGQGIGRKATGNLSNAGASLDTAFAGVRRFLRGDGIEPKCRMLRLVWMSALDELMFRWSKLPVRLRCACGMDSDHALIFAVFIWMIQTIDYSYGWGYFIV